MTREDEDRELAAAQARLERNREALGIHNERPRGPSFPNVFALVPVGNVVPIGIARRARHAKERLVPVRDGLWAKDQDELQSRLERWLEEDDDG